MVSLGNKGSGTATLATTTSSKAAEKKKKKSKSTGKHRAKKFKDDAKVDSFLHDKVSFHRKGQSVQIINNSSDSIIHPCSMLEKKSSQTWRKASETTRERPEPTSCQLILAEHKTSAYDICNAQDVFVRTGATSAERMDQEEHYARDLKIWESESREGIWK